MSKIKGHENPEAVKQDNIQVTEELALDLSVLQDLLREGGLL